jgi:hypothetical protein
MDIAAGKGVYNLTGGNVQESGEDVVSLVFNETRFPGIWRWFHAFEAHIASLPDLETTVDGDSAQWKAELQRAELWPEDLLLVPAADQNELLDERRGLVPGAMVSIAPDDTGRGDPTVESLVKIGVEEVVIVPAEKGEINVRIHFPRLGFVVKTVEGSRL